MVSDNQIEVWQDGIGLVIQSRWENDPRFTLEQERAFHEIARSFLIVNRKRENSRRQREKRKKARDEVSE